MTDVIHHPTQFWSLGIFATGLVDENLINAKFAQQDFLPSGVLILCANTDVAYFQICSSIHCNRVILHSDIFQNP